MNPHLAGAHHAIAEEVIQGAIEAAHAHLGLALLPSRTEGVLGRTDGLGIGHRAAIGQRDAHRRGWRGLLGHAGRRWHRGRRRGLGNGRRW